MGHIWQDAVRFEIAAAGTATFTVAPPFPCERLTIWATSAGRAISMTFQPQMNGANYGAATAVAAAVAADVVYRSGGATAENDLIPVPTRAQLRGEGGGTVLDPLTFTVAITNDDGVNEGIVTIYAIGVIHGA